MSGKVLSEKWLKASVLGTTWAASEIVFGSFLHNLRIPFSGNILTAIGLIILISASYKWKENGLFWRAGLICAIMKTVSPSAVIFGPMIAIFTEALLLEISVALLGKNIFGFLLGSALAMSWVLAQRIINFIIFYGSNIIDIYANLMKMAEKQFHIETDLVWLPIFVLIAIHVASGLLAGIFGILAGKSLLKPNASLSDFDFAMHKPRRGQQVGDFKFSVIWLWLNIVLIIGSMMIFVFTPTLVWVIATILIITLWATRYKSALRHLAKPKFWIFFVLITMLAAFVFASIQGGDNSFEFGLLVGLQMNFRAAIVIIGFSVIGKELYNPKVISFFQKSSARQLHTALELSFQSVPNVIATLPSAKTILKNPLAGIRYLIENAESQLSVLRYEQQNQPSVLIITGSIGEGKTSYLTKIVDDFKDHGVGVKGILTKRIVDGDQTVGYSVISISCGEERALLDSRKEIGNEKIGRFFMNIEGFRFGREKIEESKENSQLIIVDEVGKLELSGGGWHSELEKTIKTLSKPLMISVRRDFVQAVISHYEIANHSIIDIEKTSFEEALILIYKEIKL